MKHIIAIILPFFILAINLDRLSFAHFDFNTNISSEHCSESSPRKKSEHKSHIHSCVCPVLVIPMEKMLTGPIIYIQENFVLNFHHPNLKLQNFILKLYRPPIV